MGHVDTGEALDLRRNSLQMREIGLYVGVARNQYCLTRGLGACFFPLDSFFL